VRLSLDEANVKVIEHERVVELGTIRTKGSFPPWSAPFASYPFPVRREFFFLPPSKRGGLNFHVCLVPGSGRKPPV